MRTAIIGAGFLGGELARRLDAPTLVATRSGVWRDADPPAHVTMLGLDLTAPYPDGVLPRLLQCQTVLIAVAPGGAQHDRRALYVEGVDRLLAHAPRSSWRRVVYTSSTSALPERDGWLFEDTPHRPTSPRGAVQRDAEDVVLERCARADVPALVLRLAGLYGPGRPLGRVYRRRDATPLAGDGNVPTNLIHRDDAIAATLAAMNAPPHLGGIVQVCDDDHTTRRAMYDTVATARGVEPIPWERPRSDSAPRGKRVSNTKMKLELGVRLLHPTHRVT